MIKTLSILSDYMVATNDAETITQLNDYFRDAARRLAEVLQDEGVSGQCRFQSLQAEGALEPGALNAACPYEGVPEYCQGNCSDGAHQPLMQIMWSQYVANLRRIEGAKTPKESYDLFPRQLEAMTWAARGKTAGETAVIMGISTSTVNYHIKKVKEIIQTSSTTYAVAKLVESGQISI
jgi:DNA-binding CsgD family transcriptional regulator